MINTKIAKRDSRRAAPRGSAVRFTLVVKPRNSWVRVTRKQAELAVLTCFAKRDPDWAEFHLLQRVPNHD